MALPITIPNGALIIPLNLSSSYKTVTLPTVSTNPGRTLIFKDMFGNAANSTLRLSTTGLDRIERSNVSSMVLSNAYGAWTFMNDGITNWFLTNAYLNSLYMGLPPGYTNYLWSQFRNTTTSVPSITAGGAGWGTAIGTPSNYNPINYIDNDSRIGKGDNLGIVCKGFFYSSSNTTVQFRIVVDDGGYVWFNNVAVITNAWVTQPATTYTSASLNVTAGYTPFQYNFFEATGGMSCILSYSVAGAAFTQDGTGRFFHNDASKIYP